MSIVGNLAGGPGSGALILGSYFTITCTVIVDQPGLSRLVGILSAALRKEPEGASAEGLRRELLLPYRYGIGCSMRLDELPDLQALIQRMEDKDQAERITISIEMGAGVVFVAFVDGRPGLNQQVGDAVALTVSSLPVCQRHEHRTGSVPSGARRQGSRIAEQGHRSLRCRVSAGSQCR